MLCASRDAGLSTSLSDSPSEGQGSLVRQLAAIGSLPDIKALGLVGRQQPLNCGVAAARARWQEQNGRGTAQTGVHVAIDGRIRDRV
jgi:hypothetical protein